SRYISISSSHPQSVPARVLLISYFSNHDVRSHYRSRPAPVIRRGRGLPAPTLVLRQSSVVHRNMARERRHCLRPKGNTPASGSFDGVRGGMILALSEEGMAMQTLAPLESHSRVPLHISLGEPAAYLETTGYVAWADALGRAGVRFSDLPEEARARL